MKILRCSMYPPPGTGSPTTVVITDRSLDIPILEAARSMEMDGAAFVVADIFEAPDDTPEEKAILLGVHRLESSVVQKEEYDQSVFFYWNAMQLGHIKAGGILANPAPAPLSTEQLSTAMFQLMKHKNYDKHTIMCFSRNGIMVKGYRGMVEVGGKIP